MDTQEANVAVPNDERLPIRTSVVKKRGRPKKIKELKSVSVFPLKDYSKIDIAGGGFLLSDKKQTKKIRLLWYGDSPTANTGFGCVSRNILRELEKTDMFDITVLGIQFFEDPEVDLNKSWDLPYRFIAAGNNHDHDMFGRRKLLSLLRTEPFDLVITFQDLPNLELGRVALPSIRSAIEEGKKKNKVNTKWIIYTPIDGQLKPFEVLPIRQADKVILYTKYAYEEVINLVIQEAKAKTTEPDLQKYFVNNINEKLCFIYHGVDTETFYPIERSKLLQFHKEYFKIEPDEFLIINVNRNMARKALCHTIEAYLMAKKNIEKLRLYLHCKETDVGGKLKDIIHAYGDPPGIIMPESLDVIKGVDDETLNKIYNCADLYVTTSLGEGWGLTTTEAMACKVPCILPPHTSLQEIGAKGRALFTSFAGNIITHEDFYRLRPIVNTFDLASKIETIYKNREPIAEMTEKAYAWVSDLTWENIAQEWLRVIKETIGR